MKKIFFLILSCFIASLVLVSVAGQNQHKVLKERARQALLFENERQSYKVLEKTPKETTSKETTLKETTPNCIGNASWDSASISHSDFISCVECFTPQNSMGESLTTVDGYEKFFRPFAEEFYCIAKKHGLNPMYIFALGLQESYYGSSDIASFKNNLFGLGASDNAPGLNASSFLNNVEAIEDVCTLLEEYATPGTWQYRMIKEAGYDPSTIEGQSYLYSSSPGKATELKSIMETVFSK